MYRVTPAPSRGPAACAALVMAAWLAGSGPVAAQPPAPPPPRAFDRWFDIQTANLQARYRYVETSADVVSARQLQDGGALRARVKLDPKARYTVNAGVATGPTFSSGWNTTGLGTGEPVYAWHFKQLFVSATPATGVELSYGGLAFVRGESSEITSYDNDGYLVGQRVSVKRPKELFVDEVAITAGYVGDLETPGFTHRARRLDRVNYYQVLATKKATSWLSASADYTRQSSVSTVRAAVSIKTKPAVIVDVVRYEQYARAGGDAAFGFAIAGEKTATSRLTIGAGYADIDLQYGGLNGDRFNRGRRVFATGVVKLIPELSVTTFVGQAVHNHAAISNRTRVDLLLIYNALATLKRAGLLK